MKKVVFFLLINLLAFSALQAQLEGIIVETYYVSDAVDATDMLGGGLPEGSVTYRIFVDLLPGSKLLSIYGEEDHPLSFSSTEPFFNNAEDGVSFGKDLGNARRGDGTVPLDTWLTLALPYKGFFGVPKDKDTDGSQIGGENNDGGSEGIPEGLLTNDDAQAGLPLTTADGMMEGTELPTGISAEGFFDPLSQDDTSIFGLTGPLEFETITGRIVHPGISGLDEDNQVLVAQLTTRGAITFNINLEIEFEEEGLLKTVKYVSSDSIVRDGEVFNPLLSYPWICGCTDPDYLEARPNFACEDNSQCQTLAVLGCMDTSACNYDPAANINVEDLCCFVGYCNDRDISLVCPELPVLRAWPTAEDIRISPNPARAIFKVSLGFDYQEPIPFVVFDAYGRQVAEEVLRDKKQDVDLGFLEPGWYYIQFVLEDKIILTKSVALL